MNEFQIYTAGGIKPPDYGRTNRLLLRKAFAENEKIEILNPCEFENNVKNLKLGYNLNTAMEKNPDRSWQWVLRNIIKPVADDDMDAVINAEGIICIMDYNMGSGTSAEVTTAKVLDIPVWGWITPGTNIRKVKPWIINQMTTISFDLEDLKETVETYVETYYATA